MIVEVPVPTVGADAGGGWVGIGVGTGLVSGGGRTAPTGVGVIIGFAIVLGTVPMSGVVTGVAGFVTTGVGVVTAGVGVVTTGVGVGTAGSGVGTFAVGVVTVGVGVATNVAFDTTTVGAVGPEAPHALPITANRTIGLIRII